VQPVESQQPLESKPLEVQADLNADMTKGVITAEQLDFENHGIQQIDLLADEHSHQDNPINLSDEEHHQQLDLSENQQAPVEHDTNSNLSTDGFDIDDNQT